MSGILRKAVSAIEGDLESSKRHWREVKAGIEARFEAGWYPQGSRQAERAHRELAVAEEALRQLELGHVVSIWGAGA